MRDDIIEKLDDLHKQATTERSHHYVAATVKQAIAEIHRLRSEKDDLVSFLQGISYQSGAMAKSYRSAS